MNFSLDRWKDFLGQFEVLKTYYARLTDRERYIVLGFGAAGILLLLLTIYGAFAGYVASLASQIDKSRESLKEMHTLRASYSETERRVEELEQIIQQTDPNFQLATELERLAKKHNVSIDSIKERPGPPNELYQENQVSVSVRQVSLKILINFLFDIENSRQLMRITSLQVKPNFQDPAQLAVNFVVSTFQSVLGK